MASSALCVVCVYVCMETCECRNRIWLGARQGSVPRTEESTGNKMQEREEVVVLVLLSSRGLCLCFLCGGGVCVCV